MLTFKIPFAVMLLLEQADLSPDKGLKHSYSHVCQQQFSSRTGKVTRHATELFLKIGVSEKLNFYKLEYLPFKNKKKMAPYLKKNLPKIYGCLYLAFSP